MGVHPEKGTTLDFNKAMHTYCSVCKRRAGWHRMTKNGVLYCLKLNTLGKKRARIMDQNGYLFDEATKHHIDVKYLMKSGVPESVSDAIQKGMRDYMEVERNATG